MDRKNNHGSCSSHVLYDRTHNVSKFYDLGKTQSRNVIPQGPGNVQKIAEKTAETLTRLRLVFPQHFSFYQTSTCVSITR